MDVIAVNQTTYMKGCFIGTNIRYVQDTMMHFAQSSPQSTVLFLDFKKAFDSVSHTFLLCLLWKMGLPAEFVQWVQIMYSDVVSAVCHNNRLTPSIILECGVHQGCPLSCHLFNLVGQVLIFYMSDHRLFDWWMK